MSIEGRQSGLSLIELVLFIVIVGVAIGGVLSVLNTTVMHSADPLEPKQAMAVAESLMEEIQQAPFTFCDPDDAQAETATGAFVGAGGCAATVEGTGAEAGDARPFDNVSDYNGFSMTGITDVRGTAMAGLENYSAMVTVTAAALATVPNTQTVPAGDSLLITVTVTGPSGNVVKLDGYRTRYAPNALP